MPPLTFRIARDPRELEQIHALQYKAFVEEIPQHPANAHGRHVDRFHDANVYVVAVDGEDVIGSIAIRGERPFSLDGKLANLDAHLPANRRLCEIRLLNVARDRRHSSVLPGMLSALVDVALAQQFDCALISATTRQLKLYNHLGFIPFGPLVGTAEAPFQPMYLTLENFRERAKEIASLSPSTRGECVNLLPGPVGLHADVVAAFQETPRSHRGIAFEDELRAVKASLCTLTSAAHVELLLGSGTLANDAIAAQLSLLGKPGVVVSNGEFGERLADHASRAGLSFTHQRFAWGESIDFNAIGQAAWLWLVACETSTGVMNDVRAAAELCRARGTLLCVDAVSAIGAVPLDLRDVWLASGASGKALAAYPGLSMVFHHDPIAPADSLPRYLDLGLYARDLVPFTQSSNLVHALRVAVDRVDWPRRFAQLDSTGAWLRRRLRAAGLTILGDAPHVITIVLPPEVRSEEVARSLEQAGFLVGANSGYLRERNWIQVCLMGELTRDALPPLVRALGSALFVQ